MKTLILCTGNSCRSQMAEGYLKSFDNRLEVFSAGTEPGSSVHPRAIQVMQEEGIDLSQNKPKAVSEYLHEEFDYVITVCDDAKESCPVFTGKVKNRLHIGFQDPAEVTGSKNFILSEFRRIRDEIKRDFQEFYHKRIKPALSNDDIKNNVKNKYSQIIRQSNQQNQTSCCVTSGCCSTVDYAIFSENYSEKEGYNSDADLGLGCGLPTEFAAIKKDNYVLDLGSGAGNDCFIARAIVGEKGKVTGLDFTDEMLAKAIDNNQKLGYTNIQFLKGDIENIPLKNDTYDVVISNCVLNLVPDKSKAFSEIYRVLKKDGHFCISDIVIEGNLPESIKEDAEMYAGCVSGAIQKDKYLEIIKNCGFRKIQIQKVKKIKLPNPILLKYMTLDELKKFNRSKTGIFSITISARK